MFKKNSDYQSQTRINYGIRVSMVRVVRDGEQLGVMSTDKAREIAQDDGLDLVELVSNVSPPVCGILDYGKYKFDQKIKDKEKAKKQRESQQKLKILTLRPVTDDHDLKNKLSQATNFLSEGKIVQFVVVLKGRELAHRDRGIEILKRIIIDMAEVAIVDLNPKMEGDKRMICRLLPKT